MKRTPSIPCLFSPYVNPSVMSFFHAGYKVFLLILFLSYLSRCTLWKTVFKLRNCYLLLCSVVVVLGCIVMRYEDDKPPLSDHVAALCGLGHQELYATVLCLRHRSVRLFAQFWGYDLCLCAIPHLYNGSNITFLTDT